MMELRKPPSSRAATPSMVVPPGEQTISFKMCIRDRVRDEVMEFLNKNLYEAKLVYYTPTFDDKVRTFCTNPSGEVATEYYENGLAVVNGHAYKSQEYKTHNTNFALLVSKNFTKPFKTPIEYGKHVAQLSNMLCDGKILVQTFGDFLRGRRTTEERLCRNNLIPTLKDAVPGDLSLVLPHRIMVDKMCIRDRFGFAPFLTSLLTADTEVAEVSAGLLRIVAFSEPLFAVSIVATGALRGAGDSKAPFFINLFTMWGVRVMTVLVFTHRFGVTGVWISMTAELITRGIVFLIRLLRGRWLKMPVLF